MIIKIGILQLLLLNAADQSLAFTIGNHKTTSISISTTTTTTTTSINTSSITGSTTTSLKASIDPNDPYASVLDAYQKKKQTGGNINLSLPPPAAVEDPSPIASITDSVSVPIVDPPTSTADIVQAVNDAASTAIQASNEAAEAAASLMNDTAATAAAAASSVAAITSAATSALTNSDATTTTTIDTTTNAASEKAPNLVEYISKIGTHKPTTVPADTKEKLILLKNNLISTIPITPTGTSSSSGETVAAGAAGTAAMIKGTGVDMDNMNMNFDLQNINMDIDWAYFTDNLQLDEYGAWYVTAFSLLFAINQREAGRTVAEQEFEASLQEARDKAEEAAMAASVAAEGAKQAKDLVMSLPKSVTRGENAGEVLLENGKIRSLEVENELMKMEVTQLRIETVEQKNVISNLVKKSAIEEEKKTVVVKSEIPVGKSTMKRDPAEEKKFLEILKGMDQVNATAKAVALKAAEEAAAKKKAKKVRVPRKTAKKVADVAVVDVAEVTTTTAKAPAKKVAKTKAPKKARKARATKKDTKEEVEPEVVVAAVEKEPVPLFAEKEEDKASEALKVIEAAEVSFNEALAESTKEAAVIKELKSIVAKVDAGEDTSASEAPTKKTVTKAKAPRKKMGAAKAPATVTANENPWGALKESTLKRKTVAQLTEYLNERKVDVEGFSKIDMVGTIQKL